MCRDYKLKAPQFNPGTVKVGGKVFNGPMEVEDENGNMTISDEHVALKALHSWSEIVAANATSSPL